MRQYKSNFVRTAMQYAVVLMLGLMLLVGPASCKKDPQPNPTPNVPTDTITPVNPNDTITPVIPGDTIVPPIDTIQPGGDTIVPGGDTIVPTPPTGGKVVKFYYDGGKKLPPLDSVRKYANDPECDTVYIKWVRAPNQSVYLTAPSFHTVHDSLGKRFAWPKVYGLGTIWAYQILPDADSTSIVKGMIQSDKDWFESKNYRVEVLVGDKHAKAAVKPTDYNGNRVLTSGRSR